VLLVVTQKFIAVNKSYCFWPLSVMLYGAPFIVSDICFAFGTPESWSAIIYRCRNIRTLSLLIIILSDEEEITITLPLEVTLPTSWTFFLSRLLDFGILICNCNPYNHLTPWCAKRMSSKWKTRGKSRRMKKNRQEIWSLTK
jgi:hypothetical protein